MFENETRTLRILVLGSNIFFEIQFSIWNVKFKYALPKGLGLWNSNSKFALSQFKSRCHFWLLDILIWEVNFEREITELFFRLTLSTVHFWKCTYLLELRHPCSPRSLYICYFSSQTKSALMYSFSPKYPSTGNDWFGKNIRTVLIHLRIFFSHEICSDVLPEPKVPLNTEMFDLGKI